MNKYRKIAVTRDVALRQDAEELTPIEKTTSEEDVD